MTRVYLTRFTDKSQAKRHILDRYSQDLGGIKYDIDYDPSGAPFLSSCGERAGEVSISHTDGVIAIAFSQEKIGVDIERYDRKVSLGLGMDIERWTQYEAYGKWLGKGIDRELLNSILPQNLLDTRRIGDYYLTICCKSQDVDIAVLIDNGEI